MRTIVGLFKNADEARQAAEELKAIQAKEISFVVNKEDWIDRSEEINVDPNYPPIIPADGSSSIPVGITTGAVLGAIAGLALASVALPGLGTVLVAGPLLAALAGGAAGGIVGVLVSWGMTKDEAEIYTEKIKAGSAMVSADITNTEEKEAKDIFKKHKAYEIKIFEGESKPGVE